jgi:hypothetical protein
VRRIWSGSMLIYTAFRGHFRGYGEKTAFRALARMGGLLLKAFWTL